MPSTWRSTRDWPTFFAEEESAVLVVVHEEVFGEDGGVEGGGEGIGPGLPRVV